MRSLPAALSVAALAVAALTGCTATAPTAADCERSDVGSAATDLIEVTGAEGAPPTVRVRAPLYPDGVSYRDITTGTGNAVTTDAQLISVDVTVVNGASGEVLGNSSYDGTSTPVPLTQLSDPFPGLSDALRCAAEGARTVVALPADALNPELAMNYGFGEGDSAVFVLDLVKVYLPHASGTLQYNVGAGLPSVVRAPDGRPGVTIPLGDPPAETVTQTLIAGDGAEIVDGSVARLHFMTLEWSTREVTDTSWDANPVMIQMSEEAAGVVAALRGQRVGDQVLVVLPPAEDAGPDADTEVFVVDILGIDDTAQ